MATRTVAVKLVAEVGQYVSGMSQASAATMRLGETAEKSTAKTAGGFDLANKSALLMGGAVVAGLGMAISKSMEFEKSMSAVSAATGATSYTLGQLRDAAMKAGADTQYSATEAANGITEMAKAGVSAKDIMGGGLKGALSLAAAGQLDVADAAGIASVAMTQFKLSGQDLPHVADLLAAGAGKAMGSVEDLGMALNQSGLVAAAAGLNIEETTGTLAAFASAGLIGSDAGTSLKVALQMLQAPTKKASELMDSLGLDFYDTNGNMLGMADIAGQLQTRLGGLTEEQRNSALATIFGTDAVRAANVLYSEGAAGIQQWTAKVNDSGYAAKQAAALNDNLSGDLERLGGSFDTLMINIGSGLQGPLRELVQMFGGVIDTVSSVVTAFASLPGPVQAGIFALAGIAALKGPLSGTFDVLRSGVGSVTGTVGSFNEALGYARANGDGFGTVLKSVGSYAGESAKGGLSSLMGVLGGPWGLAMAGATVGIGMVTSQMSKATKQTDEWSQALLDGSMSAAKMNQEYLAQFGGKGPDWLGRAAEVLGFASSMDDAKDKAHALYDSMTPLEKAQQDVTVATNALQQAIADFGTQSPQAADAANKLAGANSWLAHMQGDVKSATDAAASALTAAQDPAKALQDGLENISDAASNSKKQIDLYKTSLDVLNGAHLTAIQAESDFYDALSASDGALKGMTGSVLNAAGGLDVQSEAGRKTFSVLAGVKDAADQYIATLIEQGATSDQANTKDAQLRASFYQTALQMTGSKDAAARLTNEIYGIPAQRSTTITADIGPAEAAINNLVKREWVTHIGLKSDYANPGIPRPGGGYAAGGYTGAGSKYTPAGIVHKGEFVFPQEAVNRIGVGNLGAMAGLPGYANGGVVGWPGGINTIVQAQADPSSLDRAAAAIQGAADQLMSSAPGPGGSVERWRGVVLQALAMLHQSPALANGILSLIQSESGGNPNAINLWDSNAKAGHPSQGLMQTIPTTFAAYAGPLRGRGITDPLASVYAGTAYALARYGPGMLASGGRHGSGGGYIGYEAGTDYVPSDGLAFLHQGERVQNRAEAASFREMRSREMAGARSSGSAGGGPVTVSIEGATIAGTFEIGGDGLGRIVDGRVVSAVTTIINRGGHNP